MKITLLTLALSGFLAFSLNAQISITIKDQSTELAGDTHTINATNGNEQIIDLLFHNNSAITQEWGITRVRLDVPATGWSDYVCWGIEGDPFGACYPANVNNPWTTPATIFVPASQAGLAAIHINPSDVANGSGHYRYYVGRTASSPQDSVDIIVNTQVLSVKENKSISLSLYPNPSSEYLVITLQSNQSESNIKITDVLGKVIFDEKVIGSKKINVEEFKNGVYLLSSSQNGTITTKRIVVKH
jgi:hypothetical protein